MQPNNLTALDFEDIKSSIKSYLKTRDEFTDYEFDGSALSYLVDILAYNSYYSAFMANMSLNEVFLSSSTVRDNIVNIAKILNYIPRSIKSATAYLHVDVQTRRTSGSYPNNVTLKKGPVATGGNYTWNLLEDRTAVVDQSTGKARLNCVKIQEGSLIKYSYLVNTFAKQRYYIPTPDADVGTLSVRVRPNETSTASDVYNVVENITTIASEDRIYFLAESEDTRYEIFFGDNVIGRSLGDGEVIDLEYLVTSGSEANEISSFTFIGRLVDSNDASYNTIDVTFTVAEISQFGDSAESVESIKFNAPRAFSAQNRAVTAQDYETITKKVYENASAVVAYGGDEIFPPVYGKVFIAIKTKTGAKLNDTTKKQISQNLRQYAMASIEPVVIDVDSIFVFPKIFVVYDPACSGRSVSNIGSNVQRGINEWAQQSDINNFNGAFSTSKMQRAVTLADKCVADVSTQISLLKYMNPTVAETNTYCVTTGSEIYDSAPGQDGGDDGSGGTCKKEPVIKSGRFRTMDRPTVDQFFEDDGYGSLVSYYNSGNRKIITNGNIGTVNYSSGQICFGPVNIIGAGGNNLPVAIPPSDPTDGGIPSTDPADGGEVAVVGGDPSSIDPPDIDPTDPTTADDGSAVDDSDQAKIDLGDISIPVMVIPSNNSTIPNPSPDTIIEVIVPEISVVPIGTPLPSNIPLNSLTPDIFEVVPTTLDLTDISNTGDLANISCF